MDILLQQRVTRLEDLVALIALELSALDPIARGLTLSDLNLMQTLLGEIREERAAQSRV